MEWTRIDEPRGQGYGTEGAMIWDNGAGLGSTRNSGRWAVEIAGKWIANVDTLAEAKTLAEKGLR